MTDDYNNENEMKFESLKCPSCDKININIEPKCFDNVNEEYTDLLMLDNDLTDLDHIIQCKACKKLFRIDIDRSTNKIIVCKQLKKIQK